MMNKRKHLPILLFLLLVALDAIYLGQAGNYASVNISASGTTQIAQGISGNQIYITGFGFTIATTSASAQTVQFVSAPTAACASGQVAVIGALSGATMVTQSGINLPTVLFLPAADVGQLPPAPLGQTLCIVTTGTQQVSGWVNYRYQ